MSGTVCMDYCFNLPYRGLEIKNRSLCTDLVLGYPQQVTWRFLHEEYFEHKESFMESPGF